VARHVVFRSPVRTLFRARAARRIRAVRSALQGPSTGGVSPVDSAAIGFTAPLLDLRCDEHRVLEVPTTGVRHMRKHAHASLLTLTPTLPSRPDPCGPTCRPDCLSWVCPKIAPPSLRIRESAARVPCLHVPLRGRTASPPRVPPPWFRTTSTDFPLRPCRSVSPCCRSWGSPCFSPSRNGPPHSALSALRSLPPADSDGSGTSPSPWARVTGATIADRPLHR
jgi:hypothetical protein